MSLPCIKDVRDVAREYHWGMGDGGRSWAIVGDDDEGRKRGK